MGTTMPVKLILVIPLLHLKLLHAVFLEDGNVLSYPLTIGIFDFF